MPNASHNRSRFLLTLAVAMFAAVHLGWEHFDGGVRSHHLLNRDDLPAISNAWGMLLLPLLAWFAIGRMQARSTSRTGWRIGGPVLLGLAGALLYGVALSVGFTLGVEAVTSAMFLGLFALAVVLPLYRAEYPLGFVLGMTFTFGAVLPTLVASVFMLLSLLAHPLARRMVKAVRRPASA